MLLNPYTLNVLIHVIIENCLEDTTQFQTHYFGVSSPHQNLHWFHKLLHWKVHRKCFGATTPFRNPHALLLFTMNFHRLVTESLHFQYDFIICITFQYHHLLVDPYTFNVFTYRHSHNINSKLLWRCYWILTLLMFSLMSSDHEINSTLSSFGYWILTLSMFSLISLYHKINYKRSSFCYWILTLSMC